MKISQMTGSQLRAFLGIKSFADRSIEEFDAYDNSHMRDTRSADDARRYIINGLTRIAFVGPKDHEDPDLLKIFESVNDHDDKIVLADELINHDTFSEIDLDVTVPSGYTGADGYVEAAKLEFIANLSGDYADDDDLLNCFKIGIHDIAREARISNRRLADLIGIPVRTVEAWSSGDREPPSYMYRLIRIALGLEPPLM